MSSQLKDPQVSSLVMLAVFSILLTFGCVPPEYPPTDNTDLNVCVRDPDCADKLAAGHRGIGEDSLWGPENTRFSFETAWKMGADSIELDVRDTVDGVPVIMHDSTVDRTTDGSGRVDEMTLAEVKSLRITHFNPVVPVQEVPTFREALAFLHGKTLVDIDIKSADIPQLVQIMEEEEMVDVAYVRVDELAQGIEARTANPGVALMPKVHNLPEVQAYQATLGSIDIFDIEYEDAVSGMVDYIRAQGIKILMDAVGDPDIAGQTGYEMLLERGADIMLTDRLESLVPFLASLP